MRELTIAPGQNALAQAIAALPQDDEPITLRLLPGTYREKVVLQRPNTTLAGENATILWDDGAKQLMADGTNRGTFRTATLLVDAPHVSLRGLTIVNAAAPREQVGQSIALYADGDFFTCEDCTLRSHQDTLFTAPLPPEELQKNGFIGPKQFAPRTPQRHTYRRCRIEGDVDFIFGGAAAWFEDCDIVSVAPGYATAASTPEGQRYGYVFYHCHFVADHLPPASCYLGRPWRDFAKTVLIDCTIGPHICSEGWHDWDKPPFHQLGFYGEYPPVPGRAGFAHGLTAQEAASYSHKALMESL